MPGVGSEALRHLSDVLARSPELRVDRIELFKDRSSQLQQQTWILAISRYLAKCVEWKQQQQELLEAVVRFMADVPTMSNSGSLDATFFLEFCSYLAAMATNRPGSVSLQLTGALVTILETPASSSSPPCKTFLAVLSAQCFQVHESAAEHLRSIFLEQWIGEEGDAEQRPDGISFPSPSQHGRSCLPQESVEALERQKIGFRLLKCTLRKSANEAQLQQLWSASARHLRLLISLLKTRKRDLSGGDASLKQKISLSLEVSEAAVTVLPKTLMMLQRTDRCLEGTLWEALTLLMDAADACISSAWRRLKACEVLFDNLLAAAADLVIARESQTILHRLRLLILRTCAYADTWGTNQGPFFKSVVNASCSMIHSCWTLDRSVVESFVLSLAAHIRQQSEQEEKEKQMMTVMQLNVIPLLSEIAVLLNKVEIVDMLMPIFVESLEEGDASAPSLLRLRLLDAVARLASLGFESSYKEAVALLIKSYKDKLSIVGSTHSRTLAPEATTERVETLPAAFLTIATKLKDHKLRVDYRFRLLVLCSEVGLVAEAKSSRSGADLIGPLLPAVAEICSNFQASRDVEPSLLKLFRNLWFYIVLFGLAPPIQKSHSSSKSYATSMSSLGSMSAMALEAVAGPYLWSAQWSAAVQRITEATPPLVVNHVKWLEDELELNALHNPGSRRASGNEKAAFTQRVALAAALGGRVEISSMSTISGAKSTYLLAVCFLELLRFSCNGGVQKDDKGRTVSTLTCTFVYLETPKLTPDIYQCFSAIVHRSFDAALTWLGNGASNAEEKETVLIAHATYLIQNLIHQNENIREMADTLLSKLRNTYPQVLWNSRCLNSLLRLVGDTSFAAVQASQAASRTFLRQRVHEWITSSLVLAPATTQGILQEQLLNGSTHSRELVTLVSKLDPDLSKVDGAPGQTARIPAVAAAAAVAAAVTTTQKAEIDILSGVFVKSTVVGEIAGIQSSYYASRRNQLQTPGDCEALFSEFLQSLQQFVTSAEKGDPVDAAAYRKVSLHSTALLLSDMGLCRMGTSESFVQLLRLLCWCPAYIFTPDAMATGISAWTWLLSAAPQLGCSILSELVDAWLWTIDTKRGLFAWGIENSGPTAKLRPQLTPGEPGPVHESVDGILAHHLWLGFLLERFEVAKRSSSEELLLIGRLLQGSVRTHSHFTCHPAATGTFFTLMLLGFKFCGWKLMQNCGTDGAILLEDRFYRASLSWFAAEPGWCDSKVEGHAQSEAQALLAFVQHQSSHYTETVPLAESMNRLSMLENGSGPICNNQKDKWKPLLFMLSQHEADRLETWAYPLKEFLPRPRIDRWSEYVRTAWSLDPRIALALVARFPFAASLKSEVTAMVQEHLTDLRRFPEALPFFVTPKAVEDNSPVLQQLPHWALCSITHALEFLTPPFKGHSRVMAYVLRVLESYPPERVTFFMPQLVQALRYDEGGLVEGYLMVAAKRSNLFAHILIWQLQGEEVPEEASKDSPVSKGNSLQDIVPRVKNRIIESFTAEALDLFRREFKLFDEVTNISGALYPLPKEERRAAIQRELEKIEVAGTDLYLPTAPTKLVRGIKVDSGIPLQSAAKVPIMITFKVIDTTANRNEIKHQACIFKVGDDCRQDVLALQVIALLRDIFVAVGLDLYLFPYGVLPTGYGRGIIEVVPNTRSRNQMGEVSDGGLYELFLQDYGSPGSPRFEAARDNFIISSAGYAVASLLLQPKDRHNGNLLFDSEGRLVHIDFGFILETSPGGNMRFESAQFKLSHEMTQLIDPSGAMKSETWNRFVSLCVKGYLAARQHMEGIVNTVWLMVDSGLPCFSRGDPIGNLRRRFHPEMSEREAANFMIRTCMDAYNKWSTAGYDLIQYLQQGIEK